MKVILSDKFLSELVQETKIFSRPSNLLACSVVCTTQAVHQVWQCWSPWDQSGDAEQKISFLV